MRKNISPHRVQGSSSGGFTLVEVMASVAILALVAAVTFTIVFGAVKRSGFIDRDLQLRTEAASIVALVAEDIRGAYVKKGAAPWFRGEDGFLMDIPTDRVMLLSSSVLPFSPEITSGSFGEVEYYVSSGEKEQVVLVRREQAPASAPYDEGGEAWEVTRRLAFFDLSYSDGEEWYDEWDASSGVGPGDGKLPRKVRIKLSLKEEDLTVTFNTVVAPVMAVGR